jgi:hypothetical protein
MLQKKTEECCTRLGSVGTQVSVDEHKLEQLTQGVETFGLSLEDVIAHQLKTYEDDLSIGEMTSL